MNFIVNETKQKLRGGYYTPIDLAQFIARWVVTNNCHSVLEPSCGDGIFINALKRENPTWNGTFVGIEFNEDEAIKSQSTLNSTSFKGTVINNDFFDWYFNDSNYHFDGVFGNPPFIRYQYLPDFMQKSASTLFDQLGLKFTKHTNAWVSFVLASIELLKPGGRMGLIIPAEIFNVLHAQALRTYIGQQCSRILIFDPEDLWFDTTLQGVVILLAEKKIDVSKKTEGLGVIRTSGRDFLNHHPEEYFHKASYLNGHSITGKWTYAFLSSKELALYTSLEQDSGFVKFNDVATVDVGIVTGANSFFLVDQKTVDEFDLHNLAHPMFGRSDHCPGILYNTKVHTDNISSGLPAHFLWINTQELTLKQQEYIKLGESLELQNRYKCRIRKPWYTVPSVYSAPIGMLKRSHHMPRLLLNEMNAFTTDTAYRVFPKNNNPEDLVFSFVNSITALSAELEGRSYGGGVLELVPSEIERLLLPILRTPIRYEDLTLLDTLVREKDICSYLPNQDKMVLKTLSGNERTSIFEAWLKLRNRRQRINLTQTQE